MPFFSFKQSSWKDDYLVGQQSDDEGSDVFEKSGTSLPERRSSIPRLILIYTTLATCYSILITAGLTRHVARSKYAGPNIIYTPARKVMDYRLTGPISAYPNEYHGDPFFGDPSPALDQGWNDRLRCKKAFTTSVPMLTVLKTPRYASLQRNSRTTTRAASFWGTGRDISLPQQRITTCTASDSSIRLSTRITTSPMIRRKGSSAEMLTPVLIPPPETASL